MVAVVKQDSNVTGLRYAEEVSLKTLSGSDVWKPLEPNSYNDFGGQLTLLARNPISAGRQRKKGVVTDLDASGGFNQDFTQTNLRDILQGFFFADLRKKATATALTSVVGSTSDWYAKTDAFDDFNPGDLLFAAGFGVAANNGLKVAHATQADNDTLKVTTDLTAETPPATATVTKVGHQFASGDLSLDYTSGAFPRLVSAAPFAMADLQLVPGELIFVGDTSNSAYSFATWAGGLARVRSVGAAYIELDKTDVPVTIDDAGSGKTIRIFFGAVLKNEVGSLIKRRTYCLERTLGAPDTASPSAEEAEYLDGSIPNELTLNIGQADKVNADLSFVSCDYKQVGAGLLRAGTRPSVVDSDAFNTSTDFSTIKLALGSNTDAYVAPLFAYLTDLKLTINNNVSPAKAVGTIGAFDVTAGTFAVDGTLEAYFASVVAVQAVRDNSDVTLHMFIVKNNAGVAIDVPLIALGDGRLTVEQDQAIKVPLSTAAAEHPVFHHTLLMSFFDYLPTNAAG